MRPTRFSSLADDRYIWKQGDSELIIEKYKGPPPFFDLTINAPVGLHITGFFRNDIHEIRDMESKIMLSIKDCQLFIECNTEKEVEIEYMTQV